MSTDILPDLLARAIKDSVKRAEVENPNGAIEGRDVALLARHCEYLLQESRVDEAEVKALVNDGVEAGVLRRRCESGLELIGQGLEAADHVLRLASRATPSRQDDPLVTRATQMVDNVRKEILNIRAVFLGYMEVLNRPLPAIDWKALEEESRAARAAGAYVRYETPEDILRDFGGQ